MKKFFTLMLSMTIFGTLYAQVVDVKSATNSVTEVISDPVDAVKETVNVLGNSFKSVTHVIEGCIELQSGSLENMKPEKKSPVYVEFDYSKATIDGMTTEKWKETLNDNLKKKFAKQLPAAEESFRKGVKGSYMVCTNDKKKAKYIIKFILGDYDPGMNNVAVSVLAKNASAAMNGTVEMFRAGDDAPFAVFKVTKLPGLGNTYVARRKFCYYAIGQYLAIKVNKAAEK